MTAGVCRFWEKPAVIDRRYSPDSGLARRCGRPRRLLGEHLSGRQRDGNEKSSRVTVPERPGNHLYLVADLDRRRLPARADQKGGRIHLQVPDVAVAVAVRYLNFQPGVRITPLELLDDAFRRHGF